MRKFVLAALGACAAGALVGAPAQANGGHGPEQGTFGFNFHGGYIIGTGNTDDGFGSFALDGNGHVVGGVIYCNHRDGTDDYTTLYTSYVQPGSYYNVTGPGVGYMELNLIGNDSSGLCGSEYGAEFGISIVNNGNQILLAILPGTGAFDGGDWAGSYKTLSGTAIKINAH